MSPSESDRVRGPVNLASLPTRADGGLEKEAGKRERAQLLERLSELQELLYAGREHALLVVLQAMDAAGKDSTTRRVFGTLNPRGCRVASFKAPSDEELAHDFLWRVHAHTPPRGSIAIFNRSHYEDVLVVRVRNLVPEERWRRRYDHIVAFERLLADEGTIVLKFYLHIGPDYQKERFERRLRRPDKHWKFNPKDLDDRALWTDYRAAYEEALERTSADHAPWYVIPAERRWYRDVLIARTVVRHLEALDMGYPKPDFDPDAIEIE